MVTQRRPICRRRSPAVRAQPRSDERDRALAGEIATGTLRWQAAFDHLIVAVRASAPLDRLDPEVLDILRLTLFQLLHLDRVPASAVVNDAVESARRRRQAERRGARQRRAAPRQPASATSCRCRRGQRSGRSRGRARLSGHHAVASRAGWSAAGCDRYGFEAAEAWARFNNAPAPLTLRVEPPAHHRGDARRRRSRGRGVETEPGALRAGRADRPEGQPAAHAARRSRACSSCRTRRRSSSRCSSGACARRARARHLRLARRQDDRDGRGDGRPRADRR